MNSFKINNNNTAVNTLQILNILVMKKFLLIFSVVLLGTQLDAQIVKTHVGTSQYDLQTNQSIQRRIAVHPTSKDVIVAKTTATVSYVPMLTAAAVIVGLYLLNMLRLRSKQRASRVKKIYTDNNRKRDILDE